MANDKMEYDKSKDKGYFLRGNMDNTDARKNAIMQKKRAAAQKMALSKKGFLSVEQVQKEKKAGTFKDWTEKYGKKK
jgi:hypothetical protein